MLQALPQSRRFAVKAAAVPAPVGGLNSRDSIDAMPPTDAIVMSNFFPSVEKVTLRDGFTQFCTGIGTGDVETLVEHNAGANRQLLAIGSDGVLYQIDSGTAVSKKTGLANGRAESVEFNGLTIFVPSGANVPFSWNGSSASDLSITLSDSANANTLTGVHAYKNRLYYFTGTDQNFYYSATVDTHQGNFTKFPTGLVGTFGGNLIMIQTITIDGGEGVDDLLALIMSSGEVLVYSGSDPSSSNFALVGTFRIAEPVNEKRACAKLGGDVIVMTKEGYLPLSAVIRQDNVGAKAAAISEKIRGTVIAQVKATGTSTGWQIFVSPDGDKVIFNYPTGETDAYNQHVFNPIIRAWCVFECGASSTATPISAARPARFSRSLATATTVRTSSAISSRPTTISVTVPASSALVQFSRCWRATPMSSSALGWRQIRSRPALSTFHLSLSLVTWRPGTRQLTMTSSTRTPAAQELRNGARL